MNDEFSDFPKFYPDAGYMNFGDALTDELDTARSELVDVTELIHRTARYMAHLVQRQERTQMAVMYLESILDFHATITEAQEAPREDAQEAAGQPEPVPAQSGQGQTITQPYRTFYGPDGEEVIQRGW